MPEKQDYLEIMLNLVLEESSKLVLKGFMPEQKFLEKKRLQKIYLKSNFIVARYMY